MSGEIVRPEQVQINGWSPDCGNESALADASSLAVKDLSRVGDRRLDKLAPQVKPNDREWQHPNVGWGLVLPDNPNVPEAAKALGEDAPEPLRRLLAARPGSPVLRWSSTQGIRALRRYYADGTPPQDLEIGAPRYGVRHGCLPRYLLIYGAPGIIPWAVQFALNMSFCVGRLDLTEAEGLDNYVNALITHWEGINGDVRAPLVWGVDHGKQDITWLMARAIANRLAAAYKADADLPGTLHLKDEAATGENLLSALTQRKPAVVVSTSHGATGPLHNAALLVAQLGLPVDAGKTPVPLDAFKDWSPRGAIWYAQACCSAGSNAPSRYLGLAEEGTSVERILAGVSQAAGARIAPLPRLLLGSKAPLRAFVGHVEPTFDWTLRQPETGEVLSGAVTTALYDELYQPGIPMPIGLALQKVFDEAGSYFSEWVTARQEVNDNVNGAIDRALYCQLVALDRQSLVILGDPTVSLPR